MDEKKDLQKNIDDKNTNSSAQEQNVSNPQNSDMHGAVPSGTIFIGIPSTDMDLPLAASNIQPLNSNTVSPGVLAPITTTTVTGANNMVTTVVTDPHKMPAGGSVTAEYTPTSVVQGTEAVRHGEEPPKVVIDAKKVVHSTPLPGVKFDFNDGLRVQIPKGEKYWLNVVDLDDCLTIFSGEVGEGVFCTSKKYYLRLRFELFKDGKMVFSHDYDCKKRNVLIKYAAGVVIGDTLAWFPYAEEFRKKHECEVYILISKTMKEILEPGYPKLHFIARTEEQEKAGEYPPGLPEDIYASYTMGVFFPCDDREHQPVDFRVMGLHRNAALILGLDEWEEHPPRLLPSAKELAERTIKDPYVCIAANGSSQAKHWNNARGWINVVKYLKMKGYRVLCIDKEDSHQVGSYMNSIPFGCEDFTGDRPLQERIDLIYHADFFIGLSSGLSWVAWGVGKPVILISGFTLPINEFTNPYRVICYHTCNGCWDDTRVTFNHSDGEWCPRHKNTERQFECTRNITPEKVCRVIDRCMKDHGFNPKGGQK